MKNLLLLVFSLLILRSTSQDSLRPQYELGIKLFSYTATGWSILPQLPRYQFETLRGFFFRISWPKKALRAYAYYSNNNFEAFRVLVELNGTTPRFSNNNDLVCSLGAQSNITGKSDCLYFFIDTYYRRYTASGDFTKDGVALNRFFKLHASQVGINSGAGFKFRVISVIYLSSEIYFDTYFLKTIYHIIEVSRNLNNVITSGNTIAKPALRLYLTAAF